MAVEALANLMAGSSPNREAVRQAGGVHVLVSLLDSGPWKDITERTTAAIAELVHTCPENQTLVRPQLTPWLTCMLYSPIDALSRQRFDV